MRDPLTINSGSLRTSIDIQASSSAGFGQALTWTTVLTTRASIRSLSLSEKSTAAGFSSQVTHRIVMRYQNSVPLKAGMRIVAATGTYDIQAIDNVQERNRVIVVLALEMEPTQ
ncbi:MAG: phage head closure protein [Acidobacteriaceae bacterium]|nr:phage head closure protein [Acidobacteriaceae bacterium]